MARVLKQSLPKPPDHYDQAYISQLVDAVNRYMFQAQAQGETIVARLIMTDPPGPADSPPTGLPTGMVYLKQVPGGAPGDVFLTIVKDTDPQ
jgi:hypothetical protein